MDAEEKQWLGSLYNEWSSQKGRFDSISSKAEVFFQLLASLLQIHTDWAEVNADFFSTMTGLYDLNPDGVLPSQYLQAYAILEVQQQGIDKKILATVRDKAAKCRDEYLSFIGAVKAKDAVRTESLQKCHKLQKKVNKKAKKGTDTERAETASALDRHVAEIKGATKDLLLILTDFNISYLDWFDPLVVLTMKFRNNPRSIILDEVGSKVIQELESQITQVADSIDFWLKEARDTPFSLGSKVDSVNMRLALQHRIAQRHLVRFARENHSEENLLFWDAVLDYKTLEDQDQRAAEAKKIWEKFLAKGSPKELNITAEVFAEVSGKLGNPTPTLFDNVVASLETTVMDDTWRKFLKSSTYDCLGKRLTRLEESNKGIKKSNSSSTVFNATPSVDSAHRRAGSTLLDGLKRFLPKKSHKDEDVPPSPELPSKAASQAPAESATPASAASTAQDADYELPDEVVKRDLHLLAANIRSQMNESTTADILFLVDNKKFKAHSFVLEARCPLFMKNAGGKPSASNPSITEISVDTSARAFKHFLEYVYSGQVPAINNAVLHDLEGLASKAHMHSLEEHCSMHAICRMEPFALCTQLVKQFPTPPADHSDEVPKYEACLAALSRHAQALFSADTDKAEHATVWSLDKSHVVNLLKRDDLVLDGEITAFEYLCRWAQRRMDSTQLKESLASILGHIRFPHILPEELRFRVEPLHIVPQDLLLEAYRFRATGVCTNVERAKPRKYNAKPLFTAPSTPITSPNVPAFQILMNEAPARRVRQTLTPSELEPMAAAATAAATTPSKQPTSVSAPTTPASTSGMVKSSSQNGLNAPAANTTRSPSPSRGDSKRDGKSSLGEKAKGLIRRASSVFAKEKKKGSVDKKDEDPKARRNSVGTGATALANLPPKNVSFDPQPEPEKVVAPEPSKTPEPKAPVEATKLTKPTEPKASAESTKTVESSPSKSSVEAAAPSENVTNSPLLEIEEDMQELLDTRKRSFTVATGTNVRRIAVPAPKKGAPKPTGDAQGADYFTFMEKLLSDPSSSDSDPASGSGHQRKRSNSTGGKEDNITAIEELLKDSEASLLSTSSIGDGAPKDRKPPSRSTSMKKAQAAPAKRDLSTVPTASIDEIEKLLEESSQAAKGNKTPEPGFEGVLLGHRITTEDKSSGESKSDK